MFNLLRNKSGLGLVEVLMAAGIAGGIALTVAKLSQDANRVTKTTETNNEINMFINDVAYTLSDKASCLATVPAGTAANGASIPDIKKVVNGVSTTTYKLFNTAPGNNKYGNNSFSLAAISTEKDPDNKVYLAIKITRHNAVVNGAKEIEKRIPLKVVFDGTGNNIASCYSDTDNIIAAAAEAACKGNSARWDAAAGECHHDIGLAGATGNPLVCPLYHVPRQLDTTGGTATFTCQPVYSSANSGCGAGSFINGWDADGEPNCTPIGGVACAAGDYLRKGASGHYECVTLPTCGDRQILIANGPGGFQCVTAACDENNEYLVAINSSGQPVCKKVSGGSCGPNEYVKQVNTDGSLQCAQVPASANLTQSDYSFVDGYNSSTGIWSRKTIDQTAQQICARITGFTWNGTNCIPTAAGTTDFEAICLKFPGHTWNGSQCVSASEFSKLINFQLRFNGTSWSVSLTRVIYSTSAADKNINVVIDSVTGSGGAFRFRIHHNTYYMNSTELISAVLSTRDGNNFNLRVGDVSGNNELEFAKADDASYNNFANGDVINVIWGY